MTGNYHTESWSHRIIQKITYAVLVLTFLSQFCFGRNERPVVGILSLPREGRDNQYYIGASYVKWLESAGARSIPIAYDATDDLVEEIFTQINGLLLPGGSSSLPPSMRKMWDLVIESNSKGDYFPVWGTCLGMEFMLTLVGGENAVQSGFDAENISLPLIFPSKGDEENTNGAFSIISQLYPQAADRQILSSSNITMNNHHKGIEPDNFISDKKLTSLFKITSTSFDRKGISFVSTIESLTMPIYGVQYHPEKNNFEYGLAPNSTLPFEAINHSEDAIAFSMRLAFFFVNQVRKNKHLYEKIHKYPFVYQYETICSITGNFEQVYIIPSARNWGDSSNTDVDIKTER